MSALRSYLGWLVPLLAWAISRALILRWAPASEEDTVRLYWVYACRIFDGKLPYSDFPVEYPPAALLFFVVPRLFGTSFGTYLKAFSVQILAFDVLLLWLVQHSQPTPGERLRAALCYVGVSFLLGPLLLRRFDLIPTACSVLAVWLVTRAPAAGWGALGLAASIKLFPASLAPVLLRGEVASDGAWTRRGLMGRAAAFTLGLLLVPAVLVTITGWPGLAALTVQLHRGVQLESVWAVPFLLARHAGASVEILFLNGAFEVSSRWTADCARLSLPLLALAMAKLALLLFRRRREPGPSSGGPPRRSLPTLAGAAAAIQVVILVLSKVLSPQFLLWIVPWIAALAAEPRRYFTMMLLLAGAALLTTWIYPYHYAALVRVEPLAAGLLLARNLLLVVMAVLLVRRIGGWPDPAPADGPNPRHG